MAPITSSWLLTTLKKETCSNVVIFLEKFKLKFSVAIWQFKPKRLICVYALTLNPLKSCRKIILFLFSPNLIRLPDNEGKIICRFNHLKNNCFMSTVVNQLSRMGWYLISFTKFVFWHTFLWCLVMQSTAAAVCSWTEIPGKVRVWPLPCVRKQVCYCTDCRDGLVGAKEFQQNRTK